MSDTCLHRLRTCRGCHLQCQPTELPVTGFINSLELPRPTVKVTEKLWENSASWEVNNLGLAPTRKILGIREGKEMHGVGLGIPVGADELKSAMSGSCADSRLLHLCSSLSSLFPFSSASSFIPPLPSPTLLLFLSLRLPFFLRFCVFICFGQAFAA